MLKKLTIFTLYSLLTFGVSSAQAALSLTKTRLIVAPGSSDSVDVINNSNIRYGMQAWVEDATEHDPGKTLVVTPNFQAIDGKQKVVLRLLSFATSGNQEQLYYLNVQEIPPKSKDSNSRNELSLAVRTKIKVLIRPSALNNNRKGAEEKIQVVRNPQGFTFKNPTPYYFAISTLKVNGKDYTKTKLGTFFPASTVNIPVTDNKASQVTIIYLDDFGAKKTAELSVQ